MFFVYDRESFYELSEEFRLTLEGPVPSAVSSCIGAGKQDEVSDERTSNV